MPWILGLLFTASFNPQVLTVNLETIQEIHATTTADLIAIATSSAAKYGLTKRQTSRMLKTIQCESGWNNSAVGSMGEVGLIQFYPPAHQDLTKEQMTNPYFELDWMAKQWSLGNAFSLWTCARELFS